MSVHDHPLIGSVFERKPARTPSSPSSRFTGAPGTGFPAVQHRSKSAFARAREEAKGNARTRTDEVPVIMSMNAPLSEPLTGQVSAQQPPLSDTEPIPTDTDALLRQISEENERKIAGMSDAELEQEKREILEHMGAGTEELLRRIREARRRKEGQERTQEETEVVECEERGQKSTEDKPKFGSGPVQTTNETHIAHPQPVPAGLAIRPSILRVKSLENIGQSVPSPLPPTSSTRPSSRTSRRLRFAEVTPKDVHVYESAPVSPKRTMFALPPPPDTKDDSIVSLGTFDGDVIPSNRSHPTHSPAEAITKNDVELEEGTPEYIRRRYFPNVPANDPSLTWIEASVPDTTDDSAPRFDLHGAPIPASLAASLPSHLGLHHHAEGCHAGYTIEDVFLLSRSTVPAQRATMLGVLAKIAHRLGRQVRNPDALERIAEFSGKEGELRKRILAAGLAAIDQIGSLGARAVELVWECLVEWDNATSDLEGVELNSVPDVLSSLQLDYLLPQITDILSHGALPLESLSQLLAIVHCVAQQSNQIADMITSTPRLIATILNSFILKSVPIQDAQPNPLALQVLITFASASRSNASALVGPADALLRFVASLPPSSPLPHILATSLLTHTLRLYTTLAYYGLYSHIATTAAQCFTALGSYVLSTSSPPESVTSSSLSPQLRIAWASLIEAWTACATDPHATSPPHEILWSQVAAWGWAADVRRLREDMSAPFSDEALYAAMWNAEAVWLEGARINGVLGGKGEREEALEVLGRVFNADKGSEYGVVRNAIGAAQRILANEMPTNGKEAGRMLAELARHGTLLASALRLWFACLPALPAGSPLASPPFPLPFAELSSLSAAVAKHGLWTPPTEFGAYLRVHLRPLTAFLARFHRVSRYIPGTTPQLWLAQTLVFMPRLLPGDEVFALGMLDAFACINPQFIGLELEGLGSSIDVLRPFFEYTIRPNSEAYIAPLRPSPESITRASTLRLPSPSLSTLSDDTNATKTSIPSGLPLTPDFLSIPLTHLLRSGSSPIFSGSIAILPSWVPSETDIVRATLLLVHAVRGVLIGHGLSTFGPGPADIVFLCMRVCMLEHGVGVGAAGGTEEVFRDGVVERLMQALLEVYTARSPVSPSSSSHERTCSLESASAPYLGPTNTPFYQFYTDLVALYAAVSFAHPIFGALLVSPLAMHYEGDYRRALWCDGEVGSGVSTGPSATLPHNLPTSANATPAPSDIVRTLRVPLEDVVCCWGPPGDLREYLYPLDRDVELLGAYVGALIGGGREVEGFLRLVAVHHVAGAIWGDLGGQGGGDLPEGTRVRLLRGVMVRGDGRVVREVVMYRQKEVGSGDFVTPPACYECGEDGDAAWREKRLGFVKGAFGEGVVERVKGLLMPGKL